MNQLLWVRSEKHIFNKCNRPAEPTVLLESGRVTNQRQERRKGIVNWNEREKETNPSTNYITEVGLESWSLIRLFRLLGVWSWEFSPPNLFQGNSAINFSYWWFFCAFVLLVHSEEKPSRFQLSRKIWIRWFGFWFKVNQRIFSLNFHGCFYYCLIRTSWSFFWS